MIDNLLFHRKQCIGSGSVLILYICLGGMSSVTSAVEPNNTLVTESEFFSDIPPIATVTRLAQPKSETPAAVTVIDREMIRASGIRNIEDLFRLVPGFQVAHSRAPVPTVTYHGLGDTFARRMQVLIDGRSAYDTFIGGVPWANLAISIEDIDHIEVTRGPNTATYGANAFFGTINIITRHAEQERGASILLASGDHDIKDATLRLGKGFSWADFRLSFGYNSEDGLEEIRDGNHTRFANIRADFVPSEQDTLLFQAGIGRNTPETGNNTILFPYRESEGTSQFVQIHWQHHFSDDHVLGIQFYRNRYVHHDSYLSKPFTLAPFGVIQIPLSTDIEQYRHDVEVQHSFSSGADWRFVWGAGAREDNVDSYPYFTTNDAIRSTSSRVFANAEWRATLNMLINLGGMWEHIDFAGNEFSPRVAINYHFTGNDTVRAVWSKARRIPSLFEENADTRIYIRNFLYDHLFNAQGNLRPETLTSYELGYLSYFPSSRLSFDMRLYRDHIDDFITQVTIAAPDILNNTAYSFRNEGSIDVDGIDFELVYRPDRNNRIVLTTAFMQASAENFSNNTVRNSETLEKTVPATSGSLLFMHRFTDNWDGSLAYYWVDEMLWLKDLPQSKTNTVDSYTRMDIRIAYHFRLGEKHGELAAVVQNAGDEYADFDNNQYFERRTFLTLRLDL